MPMATRALSAANSSITLDARTMTIDDERLLRCDDVDEMSKKTRLVKVLPIESTNAGMYEDILKLAPSSSTVYVFDSSWHALEESIALFGDNIPRGNGRTRTILGRDLQLSLNFPSWSWPAGSSRTSQGADSDLGAAGGLGQANQQNEALMNVWTNLVSEDEMSELLSARIVGS